MFSLKVLSQKLVHVLKGVRCYSLHVLAASLFLVLVFVVYWRDLEILVSEALNTEALSHVLLMPFLAGFLIYNKKDLIKASLALNRLQKRSKIGYLDFFVGLSLCIVAFLLYWHGSYTFYPLEYHLLSLPIFISGIVLAVFSFKTLRILLFPIMFLFFIVPLPNEVAYMLGGALANFNTQVAYTILNGFGLPVTLSTYYGAPTLILENSAQPQFTVDLPCSGLYSLIAFAMFAFFLALTVSASMWKKIMTFLLGFSIFEILNILRITLIVSSAYFFGEEIAMQYFHAFTGLIFIFVGMLLTLFLSDKILKINFSFQKSKSKPCPKCKEYSANSTFCLNCGEFINRALWKPSKIFWGKTLLLLLICSVMALSVNAPVFAVTQELEFISAENSTSILPQIPQYSLMFIERDSYYERIAKQDAALRYAYISPNITLPVVYVLVNVANSISNLHSWEVCLITWRTAQGQYPLVSVLESRDLQILEENPVIARYLVFQNTQQNYTQVTLYWYERATFKTGGTVQQKYVRISLLILTEDATNYQQHENLLLDFGEAIASHWEPLTTQSLISLGVPAQQALLILSIAFIIVAKTTQHASEWRKRINNLKIFNNFASSEDKLVLQTLTELSKERRAVATEDINSAIKSKVGKGMKFERLIERLNHLQGYGFVKRDLASDNNQPVLVWKSLVRV